MTETISAAQYRQTKPKKSKYRSIKAMVDGIVFHSRKEAARYEVLRDKQKRGEISHLELQPKFKLYGRSGPLLIRSKGYPNGRHMTWSGDFSYFCPERSKRIVEDVKGIRTQVFIMKKTIVEENYPAVEIVEI